MVAHSRQHLHLQAAEDAIYFARRMSLSPAQTNVIRHLCTLNAIDRGARGCPRQIIYEQLRAELDMNIREDEIPVMRIPDRLKEELHRKIMSRSVKSLLNAFIEILEAPNTVTYLEQDTGQTKCCYSSRPYGLLVDKMIDKVERRLRQFSSATPGKRRARYDPDYDTEPIYLERDSDEFPGDTC